MDTFWEALDQAVRQYQGGHFELHFGEDPLGQVRLAGLIEGIDVREGISNRPELFIEPVSGLPLNFPEYLYEGPLVHTTIGEGIGIVLLPGNGYLALRTPERLEQDCMTTKKVE